MGVVGQIIPWNFPLLMEGVGYADDELDELLKGLEGDTRGLSVLTYSVHWPSHGGEPRRRLPHHGVGSSRPRCDPCER